MTGNDTGLLVVTCGVASKLEDLSCQVLEDGGEVDGGTGTDTLSVVTALQEPVDTADRELKTGLGRARGALAGRVTARLSFAARHIDCRVEEA